MRESSRDTRRARASPHDCRLREPRGYAARPRPNGRSGHRLCQRRPLVHPLRSPHLHKLGPERTRVPGVSRSSGIKADDLLTEAKLTDPSAFDETVANKTRGRMLLARGDTEAALQEAAAIVAHGEASRNDDLLFLGLALEARCHHRLENHEASLEACNRFLTRWDEAPPRRETLQSRCARLLPMLAEASRHDDIRRAALRLPVICRWRDALHTHRRRSIRRSS